MTVKSVIVLRCHPPILKPEFRDFTVMRVLFDAHYLVPSSLHATYHLRTAAAEGHKQPTRSN